MTTPANDDRKAYEVVAHLGERMRLAAVLPESSASAAPPRVLDESAISAALLARLSQHEATADQLVFCATIAPRTFEPAALRGGLAATPEPREWDLDYELTAAMKERVPQALLRDLHRPIREFSIRYEVDEALSAYVEDAPSTAREMMAATYDVMPGPASALALPEDVKNLKEMLRTAPWGISGKDVR